MVIKKTPSSSRGEALRSAPKQSLREEFARNLYRAIQHKGWTQSDLGRHTGIARDSISHYIAGRNMPGPVNAKRLADALGIEISQMMPWTAADPITGDAPEMETKFMPGGKTWISINKVVDLDTAHKIITLIRDYETAH